MQGEIIPIELTEIYPAGTVKSTGSRVFILAERDKVELRIKVHDGGWVDCLAETVPNGKQWNLAVGFFLKETDA